MSCAYRKHFRPPPLTYLLVFLQQCYPRSSFTHFMQIRSLSALQPSFGQFSPFLFIYLRKSRATHTYIYIVRLSSRCILRKHTVDIISWWSVKGYRLKFKYTRRSFDIVYLQENGVRWKSTNKYTLLLLLQKEREREGHKNVFAPRTYM